jgi:hypothetical protein
MDARIFEILRNKPELVTAFPRWMLSEALEKELRDTEGVAIIEIAGRDSIAAPASGISRHFFQLLPIRALNLATGRLPLKRRMC